MEKEIFEYIVQKAFEAGETWGCTYHGWFTPDENDTENHIKEAKTKIKRVLTQKGIKIT